MEIVGIILTIAGIIVLIAGVILLVLDRSRIGPRIQTSSSSATTNTASEPIVLASWIERFIAWLIDFIIVSIGLAAVSGPLTLYQVWYSWLIGLILNRLEANL